MQTSEPLLFDSNVLIYAHNEDSPFHLQAIHLITKVIKGKIFGVLTPQNLLEFYSVITDKRRLANPINPRQASELIKEYLSSSFEIIYSDVNTNRIMAELVKKNQFRNGQIFDVFLIATMLSNNIRHIVTANVKDFQKFDGIRVLDLKTFSLDS